MTKNGQYAFPTHIRNQLTNMCMCCTMYSTGLYFHDCSFSFRIFWETIVLCKTLFDLHFYIVLGVSSKMNLNCMVRAKYFLKGEELQSLALFYVYYIFYLCGGIEIKTEFCHTKHVNVENTDDFLFWFPFNIRIFVVH